MPGTIEKILGAETRDLAKLAKIAGDDNPLDFYTYVNLDSIDLGDADTRALVDSLRKMVADYNPEAPLRAEWEERIAAFEQQRFGESTIEDGRKLKFAYDNFFYRLATAYGEQPEGADWRIYDKPLTTKNRRFWNRWWYAKLRESALKVTEKQRTVIEEQLHQEDKQPLSKEEQGLYEEIITELSEPKNLEMIDFSQLSFTRILALDDFVFMVNCTFDNSIATHDVFCYRTSFSDEANFTHASFRGKADFTKARFSGKADFTKARFSGTVNFDDTHYDSNVDFGNVCFASKAYFRRAKFSGVSDFCSARFNETTSFFNSTFDDNPSFRNANFRKSPNFRDVTSVENSSFPNARLIYGRPKSLKL